MPNLFRTAAESRSPSVLIIDDEPQLRNFLSEALREQGYFVDTAIDGESADRRNPAPAPIHP